MIKIVALIFMGVLASLGSFFLKKATEKGLSIPVLLCTPWLYLGGAFYAVSALLNLYLLKILPYSLVVPLGSLTYIWTLILSNRILQERTTGCNFAGICLIMFGVAIVAIF